MADFSEETNNLVVTAFKMGADGAKLQYEERVKMLKEELEKAEHDWEVICNKYSATNHQLRTTVEHYRAALQKVMDDCKWWSRDNWCGGVGCPCHIALKALEVNNDRI